MQVGTIPELFQDAVKNRPRPDCFSYRGEDGAYTAVSSAEVHERVMALRHGLKALGVKPGDRVAILSENRLEWVLSDLGSQCAGAATVPIYATLLPEMIDFILKDCEPVVIFVSTAEQAEKIEGLRSGLPFVRDVVCFEPCGGDTLPFEKLTQMGRNLIEDAPDGADECVVTDRNAPCSIIYTSGTTGNPKGVVLSHWNFVSNVQNVLSAFAFSPADEALSFLPLSHVFERTGYYMLLSAGVHIAFAERMDTVPVDILDVKPTVIISVPRLYEKIYAKATSTAIASNALRKNIFFWARDLAIKWARLTETGKRPGPWLTLQFRVADALVFKKLRAKMGGRLRALISGGAPLSPRINAFFHGAGLNICEGYGLTETSPVLTCNKLDDHRFGSVGKTIPDTEVRIAQDGEIQARGPQIMLGYFHNEEATSEVLDADGWFSTGDIGHFDDDNFLFITDRKKDLIVTAGGKNIAPQPLENRFRADKFVSQIVVIGDRRHFLSALIVPDFETLGGWARAQGLADGSSYLATNKQVRELFEGLVAKINADFPGFSQIKKFALLEDEFTLENGELTPTLKVKRFAIANKYADVIDSLYPEAVPGDAD